jgi:hypothetical protein
MLRAVLIGVENLGHLRGAIPHNVNDLSVRGDAAPYNTYSMAHEDLTREQNVKGSSDRVFGLVFAALFLLIALGPLRHRLPPRWWAIGIAAIFALIALLQPALLSGLNRLWMKLGILLGKVVSPIALGILFYGILTPVGAMIRLAGKDPLRLKFDSAANSYWITRKPPGPRPDSMTNQF